jgi:hypothetical protein
VHPHRAIQTIAAEAGLQEDYSATKGLWQIVTFVRSPVERAV